MSDFGYEVLIEEVNQEKLVREREAKLLASIAAKLRGRVLFPEKVENAKKYVRLIASSPL